MRPYYHQAFDSQRVDQLYERVRKRPTEAAGNNDIKRPVAKKARRSKFLEVSGIKANEDCCQNLERMGSDWSRFYTAQTATDQLPGVEIYRILALVSAIGSPQVLLDIADLYQDMPYQPLQASQKLNQTAKAYWLYNHAQASVIGGHIQQRLLSVIIYRKFEALHKYYKDWLLSRRKDSRLKSSKLKGPSGNGSPKDSTSYALDALVALCHNTDIADVRADSNLQLERKKITKLKNRGEGLSNFNQRFREVYGGDENMHVCSLLPARKMKSVLDGNVKVDVQQYVINCNIAVRQLIISKVFRSERKKPGGLHESHSTASTKTGFSLSSGRTIRLDFFRRS